MTTTVWTQSAIAKVSVYRLGDRKQSVFENRTTSEWRTAALNLWCSVSQTR
ncbi:MAG: hypothetical protein K6T90_03835 [Leptolyngbyaceae cyanobacterium HOT.MB2.61]|nr:hypothetical protein [Leptolyngbyaceae cyanobacterium HOT.MB2.61]